MCALKFKSSQGVWMLLLTCCTGVGALTIPHIHTARQTHTATCNDSTLRALSLAPVCRLSVFL